MKRSLSDSDSDGDMDSFKDGYSSPSQSSHTGHGPDRKKRRGVIEKRRRDRINNSLSELRRLVPTAFEKQGSTKLEKAEILQMTVDHLKILHQKGLNGYNYDPASLAMDYRSVGFRECAAEVARYLVSIEGLDIQDPMRIRLTSHLQCYSAQREAATKTQMLNTSWSSMSSHTSYSSQYPGIGSGMSGMTGPPSHPPPPTAPSSMISQHPSQRDVVDQLSSSISTNDHMRLSQPSMHDNMNLRLPTSMPPPQVPSITTTTSQPSAPAFHHPHQFPNVHSGFTSSLNSMMPSMLSPSTAYQMTSSGKPYRPWGAEIAY